MQTAPAPPLRRSRRGPRAASVALLLATVGLTLTLLHHSLTGWAPTTGAEAPPPAEVDGLVTSADGLLPDGVTVADDTLPGIARLDPELLAALRAAAADAAEDGVVLQVNSGWRSAEYQEQLLAEAVATYGSRAEAERWVATAGTSPHVSGDAVDIGPTDAAYWLGRHGADHGLCQVYGNEPWHFELRPEAVDDGCPPSFADPTEDPRMRG
ncbi:peptidase M15 [Desertihabitans brevis]|uniref:Peptidase M15 n=1 Tax=Desertihabitans brevis TaxID=2268447 RepID=A0A367YQH9_9ACTN|nr:M15 family metallopeptidase [Desertihabitans brevis]RCK68078.1 peptidase M15 [Desertihabitans brevis]